MSDWEDRFIAALAATGSVTSAVAEVGVSRSTVYRRRRQDGAFHERWTAALERHEAAEHPVITDIVTADAIAWALRAMARDLGRRGLAHQAEELAELAEMVQRLYEPVATSEADVPVTQLAQPLPSGHSGHLKSAQARGPRSPRFWPDGTRRDPDNPKGQRVRNTPQDWGSRQF